MNKYPEKSSSAQPKWLKEKAISLGWEEKLLPGKDWYSGRRVKRLSWWHKQHGRFAFGTCPVDKTRGWFFYWHDEKRGRIGPFASMYGVITAFNDPAFLIQRHLIEDFWRSHGTFQDRCRSCDEGLSPSGISDITLGVCPIVTCGLCGAGNILRPRGTPAPSALVAQLS